MIEAPPVKYPYESVNWAFLKWADIESAFKPGMTYLRRLRIFQTPWFALYLHFIFEPDDDRDPHDHPCNFWSLILRGGYKERVFKNPHERNFAWNTKVWPRWSLHKMPVEWAHRITNLEPGTITLCWFGRRQREWGFWTSEGFVSFREYDRVGQGADPWGA